MNLAVSGQEDGRKLCERSMEKLCCRACSHCEVPPAPEKHDMIRGGALRRKVNTLHNNVGEQTDA